MFEFIQLIREDAGKVPDFLLKPDVTLTSLHPHSNRAKPLSLFYLEPTRAIF